MNHDTNYQAHHQTEHDIHNNELELTSVDSAVP